MLSKISYFLIIISAIFFSAVATFAADAYPVKVVGGRHRLVLLSDGTVVGWGATDWGALGSIAAIPQNSNHSTQLVSIKLPRKAIDIAATMESSFALLDDGTVVGWGTNLITFLGIGDIKLKMSTGKDGSETPLKIPNLSDIMKIAASSDGVVALRKDGTIYIWGSKTFFGDGKTPVQVPGLKNIREISAGNTCGMALDANGRVWTWAKGERTAQYGVLGRTDNLEGVGQVEGLSDVVSIAAQNGVATVVKKDGTVWVWGSNHMAQLANGRRSEPPNRGDDSEVVSVPRQVAGIRNAVSVADGGGRSNFTMVLLKDGTLRTWGNSQQGESGAGITDYIYKPVIPKISGVKAIFPVMTNTFAIKNDNTLWMWGAVNYFGYPFNKQEAYPKLLQLK
jgi:alpha-tubulin suppressor-like RCC1 family protein